MKEDPKKEYFETTWEPGQKKPSLLYDIILLFGMIVLCLVTIHHAIGEFVVPFYRYHHDYVITANGKKVPFYVVEEQSFSIIPFFVKGQSSWEGSFVGEEIRASDFNQLSIQEYRCKTKNVEKIACNDTIKDLEKIELKNVQYRYQIKKEDTILYDGMTLPNFEAYFIEDGYYYIILSRTSEDGDTTITIRYKNMV